MAPVKPKRRQCGSMEAHERLSELYSSFRTNQNRIESFTARSITSGLAARVARQLITIPVVVHVVYKKAEENISDAQIKSQIAVLNEDFRATNTDATNTPVGVERPGGGRQHPVRAGHEGPEREGDHRDHAHRDHANVVRRRRQRQDEGRRRRARVAGRTVPQPLGVQPRRRPARLRAVPRRPRQDRRRRDPALGVRHDGHRGGAVQPRPHGDARDRPLAQPAPHLGRRRTTAAGPTTSPDTPNAQRRTTASRRSRTSPATTARTATCS